MQHTDKESFLFNLNSNGRMKQPMKFEILNTMEGGIILSKKEEDTLICLGEISLMKKGIESESIWFKRMAFNYHGIDNAICIGLNNNNKHANFFEIKRIVVIQMK